MNVEISLLMIKTNRSTEHSVSQSYNLSASKLRSKLKVNKKLPPIDINISETSKQNNELIKSINELQKSGTLLSKLPSKHGSSQIMLQSVAVIPSQSANLESLAGTQTIDLSTQIQNVLKKTTESTLERIATYNEDAKIIRKKTKPQNSSEVSALSAIIDGEDDTKIPVKQALTKPVPLNDPDLKVC